jgi:hypothetical protein
VSSFGDVPNLGELLPTGKVRRTHHLGIWLPNANTLMYR